MIVFVREQMTLLLKEQMTLLDKNTITFPNAQETYPNLVDSVNEGMSYYTIPITIMSIGVIALIAGSILQFKIKRDFKREREEERDYSRLDIPFYLLMSFLFFLGVASFASAILSHKVEKDTNILAEHVSQHSETEDKVTELANTIGFDYKDVCDTIVDNRESSLCGGELFESINWGDKDDIYHIDPDYDYNNAEDELIVTFNLKELTEEQS